MAKYKRKKNKASFYERFKYRIWNMSFCIFFILTGICFAVDIRGLFLKRLDQTVDINLYGPRICMAANQPNQFFRIYAITDDKGKTNLAIYWEETENTGFEKLKLWIAIDDYCAPFTWKAENNALAMDLYSVNGIDYRASVLGQTSGTDQQVGFLIVFEKGISHTARITLHTAEGDYIVRNREKSNLRVPIIAYWTNYKIKDTPENMLVSDSRWINKTIMGEELFIPIMNISASVDNLEAENSDLMLSVVEPQANYNERYIWWKGEFVLFPQVQYIDTERENELEQQKEIAGMFFGMGLSCLILSIGNKNEIGMGGKNDEKKKTTHSRIHS